MSRAELKPIPGFPEYSASTDGRIWSEKSNRWLATPPSGGYPRVNLLRDGKQYHRKVHVLVALTWIGARPTGMQVRHLDGDSTNNRLDNLTYGTPSENIADSVTHGTHRNSRKTRCHKGHRFTEENTYVRADGSRRCKACRRKGAEHVQA